MGYLGTIRNLRLGSYRLELWSLESKLSLAGVPEKKGPQCDSHREARTICELSCIATPVQNGCALMQLVQIYASYFENDIEFAMIIIVTRPRECLLIALDSNHDRIGGYRVFIRHLCHTPPFFSRSAPRSRVLGGVTSRLIGVSDSS